MFRHPCFLIIQSYTDGVFTSTFSSDSPPSLEGLLSPLPFPCNSAAFFTLSALSSSSALIRSNSNAVFGVCLLFSIIVCLEIAPILRCHNISFIADSVSTGLFTLKLQSRVSNNSSFIGVPCNANNFLIYSHLTAKPSFSANIFCLATLSVELNSMESETSETFNYVIVKAFYPLLLMVSHKFGIYFYLRHYPFR